MPLGRLPVRDSVRDLNWNEEVMGDCWKKEKVACGEVSCPPPMKDDSRRLRDMFDSS